MGEMKLNDIFETIQKYRMIEPGMGVVAGVSGGADSVCLLYVLKEYRKKVPFTLTAVHVEHGIRGSASLGDAAFTEALCHQMDVPCRIVPVDVQRIAREQGLTVEEAGRRERYRIFEEIRQKERADRIAVAHNRNDQAETMLWNLVRGSGLKGLGGIRPVRENIVRPLLFTDRKKIEQILGEAGLSWRTDATNLEQEYTRNRIRLSLIPLMERELNAQAGLHMAQAAEKLQQVQAYLERMTHLAVQQCIAEKEDSVVLYLVDFAGQDPLIQTELLKAALLRCKRGCALKDIGRVHLKMLQELAAMDCGKEVHLPGIRAVREDGIIRFQQFDGKLHRTPEYSAENSKLAIQAKAGQSKEHPESAMQEYPLMIPGHQQIDRMLVHTVLLENDASLKEKIAEEKKYTKWLSYDTITSDARIRKRRPGDYLLINEAGGRKKLKDYLIDCKIPKDRRDQIWLLADGSHILWVIGCRISSKAKVTQETKRVLKIQIEEVLE